MLAKHPKLALLGWLIWPIGVVAFRNKPWVHEDGFFSLGGNTPIFWWPNRLSKHLQRGGRL